MHSSAGVAQSSADMDSYVGETEQQDDITIPMFDMMPKKYKSQTEKASGFFEHPAAETTFFWYAVW